NNSQEGINSLQHVLNMAPLNSMPYNCPLGDISSSRSKGEGKTGAIGKFRPAKIFFPCHSPREDWETLTAASAMIAPVLRLMALGESDDSYFRVNLLGVSRDEKNFSWDIKPDGKILIPGVTTIGKKIVCTKAQTSRIFPPPGPFFISFQLPGPVEHIQLTSLYIHGVIEWLVSKIMLKKTQLGEWIFLLSMMSQGRDGDLDLFYDQEKKTFD
ncbi:LOW QUALITY PROTEIN: hypothetical protein CFOL_v3_01371, partial [Cephalotus follicularis]